MSMRQQRLLFISRPINSAVSRPLSGNVYVPLQAVYNRRLFSFHAHFLDVSQPPRRAKQPAPKTWHLAIPKAPPSCSPLPKISVQSMSSDADYSAFLDKANQDTGSAEAQEVLQKKKYGTKSVNTAVPSALKQVEEYYVSDSDEPFEPVALAFDGNDVSADDVKKLVGSDEVEEVKDTGFVSQYKRVMDAVKQAGNGTVKVFRVELESTRAEYYVVVVDDKEGRLVGLKALAVES